MAKKKQSESVAIKSTMVLRPRTPTIGEEKVNGEKIAVRGKGSKASLTVRNVKSKKNIHTTGSTRVLRSQTREAKGEMLVKVDEKAKGKMPVEVHEKTDGKNTVASGNIKTGNAVKTGSAAKRKLVADKGNSEVAGSKVKKLKAVMNMNEIDKGASTGSTRVLRSSSAKKGDEFGKEDAKKKYAEAKTKKLKKNLQAPLTIQSPNPKRNNSVKKKTSPTTGTLKLKKNLLSEASKRIARKGGKSKDPLPRERAEDATGNNHRIEGFKNQEIGTNKQNQLVKRKKTKIVITDSVVPSEIIMEILSWLPVEFFGAPMVVCKQWYALIQDRHFIEKHMKRNISYLESKVTQGYKEVDVFDGLILEMNTSTQKYRICNPDIKQFLELPDPHSGSHGMLFSYVPPTLNYKIVSIYDDENSIECCEILSVGNDELSWRPLKMPTIDFPNRNRKELFIISTGEVVYCVRVIASGDDMVEEVVSLDLGTEQFTVTNLPKGQYKSWEKVWPINYKGKLALVNIVGAELCILVLENYKKQKWGEKESLVPLELMKKLEVEHGTIIPCIVDQSERLWFWVEDTSDYIYYDIKTKYVCLKHGYWHSLVRLKGMQAE